MFFKPALLLVMGLSLLLLPACSGEKKEAEHHEEKAHEKAEGHKDEHDGKHEDKHKDEHEGEHHDEAPSDTVTLSREAAESGGIKVEEVREKAMPVAMELPARLLPDETRVARVNSRTPGRVTTISVAVGDRVATGKPLAMLESRELAEAELAYREAHTALKMARGSLERVKLLVEGKAMARKQLVEEEGRHANAEARLANAGERLRLLGIAVPDVGAQHAAPLQNTITIQSPISGTVLERTVTPGETVDPSKTLFTIADLSTLWVVAEVPENEIAQVRKGQRATVTVDAMPGKVFAAVIDHVYDILDPETRRVKVRASLKNPGTLKPEMFATLKVASGKTEVAPAIPAAAVVREGEKTAVFVEEEPFSFSKRPVELGHVQGGYHRVLSGLKAGERIAIKGAFTLKAEMEKGELGEGHAH